jgi:hypothetical protein
MYGVEIYVRQFVFLQGLSRREVARRLGLSRDIVSKMCRYEAPPDTGVRSLCRGSTTWLSIPSASSTRWIQKPSSPASWMTMIGKLFPIRASAFRLSSANRVSMPATSSAATACLDIFSPAPGDGEVISHFERLSSNETKIAPRSVRIAVDASGWCAATGVLAPPR